MARAVKTTKSSTQGQTKRKAKPAKKASLLKSLPQSVENIEIVQQVASVLAELQNRVIDVKTEASKELKKLMSRYETHYRGLEKRVHDVTLDAKKQAQTSMIHVLQKWHEHKEKLPAPLAKEIEKIIEQIGTKMMTKASKPKPVKKTVARAKKKAPVAQKAAPAKKPRATQKPKPAMKAKASTIHTPDIQ